MSGNGGQNYPPYKNKVVYNEDQQIKKKQVLHPSSLQLAKHLVELDTSDSSVKLQHNNPNI